MRPHGRIPLNRRPTRAPRAVLPAVALLGAGLLGAAHADTRYPEDLLELPFEDLLEVKIRSAGKREEEIRDIPASVTILTREDIARYGWTTFEELLRNVPGFYLLDNIEDRFIGTRGTAGGGVQFLVNDIPQHPSLQKTLTATEIARLDIPVESIDRVEIIRGPMSVIYGNNAFLGVVNVVTNRIDQSGPRVSASLGSEESGRLFARAGTVFEDGFVVLNAGGYRTGGLTGAYADMMGPEQLAALSPGMRRDMDGDMDQRLGSLDLSAQWRGWEANVRYNQRDYGIYGFTPPFDEGTRVRLDTLHASMGYARSLSDELGLRLPGIYSQERYDAYQLDFLLPEVGGDQGNKRGRTKRGLTWADPFYSGKQSDSMSSEPNEPTRLRAEVAQLIALLESKGLDWRHPPMPTTASNLPPSEPLDLSTAEGARLFRRLCAGGAPMRTRCAGRARRAAHQATPPRARQAGKLGEG